MAHVSDTGVTRPISHYTDKQTVGSHHCHACPLALPKSQYGVRTAWSVNQSSRGRAGDDLHLHLVYIVFKKHFERLLSTLLSICLYARIYGLSLVKPPTILSLCGPRMGPLTSSQVIRLSDSVLFWSHLCCHPEVLFKFSRRWIGPTSLYTITLYLAAAA